MGEETGWKITYKQANINCAYAYI